MDLWPAPLASRARGVLRHVGVRTPCPRHPGRCPRVAIGRPLVPFYAAGRAVSDVYPVGLDGRRSALVLVSLLLLSAARCGRGTSCQRRLAHGERTTMMPAITMTKNPAAMPAIGPPLPAGSARPRTGDRGPRFCWLPSPRRPSAPSRCDAPAASGPRCYPEPSPLSVRRGTPPFAAGGAVHGCRRPDHLGFGRIPVGGAVRLPGPIRRFPGIAPVLVATRSSAFPQRRVALCWPAEPWCAACRLVKKPAPPGPRCFCPVLGRAATGTPCPQI